MRYKESKSVEIVEYVRAECPYCKKENKIYGGLWKFSGKGLARFCEWTACAKLFVVKIK